MHKKKINHISEFLPFCQDIMHKKYPGTVILQGDLGAGKTTFVRTFVEQWKQDILVSSPTFTLMNVYPVQDKIIHHFDWYRLSGLEEALELGFDEAVSLCDFAFIEWAERAWELIPVPYTKITLEHGTHEKQRLLSLSIIEV